MALKSKIINDCQKVKARLEKLKSEHSGEGFWWKGAIDIEWSNCRKGNNGTQWCSVKYIDSDGVSGNNLVLRLIGERHSGQIMPNTDAGLAELVAGKNANASYKYEKRTKKPCIQIQQWKAQVKTADDGITLLTDASGAAILPPDSMLSAYYAVASYVNEAFTTGVNSRIDKGRELVKLATTMKASNKSVTASAILTAFGIVQGGDLILATESTNILRKLFPGKEFEILTKGAITTSNIKVAELVQTRISDASLKNSGCDLPNPMTRIGMRFKDTGVSEIPIYDKSKPFMTEDGKKKFEAATVDDVPVNADNVHKAILSGTTIDGIAEMSAVCFSIMGISIPASLEVAVYENANGRTTIDIGDIYETEVVSSKAETKVSSKAETLVSSKAETLVSSKVETLVSAKANSEDNYEALLNDLTTGN